MIVTSVDRRDTYKKRPLPLNTVAALKLLSTHLKLPAAKSMTLMESLYTKGLLSYPRTETDRYPKTFFMKSLANKANGSEFEDFYGPRPDGKNDDKAHPPIYPVRAAKDGDFDSKNGTMEKKVFNFLVNHFFAQLCKDATGVETSIKVNILDEEFFLKGLKITQKNHLKYFDKWQEIKSPDVKVGQKLEDFELQQVETETKPPIPMTESQLITLMSKHGIGTDATIHDHIKRV